MSNISTIGIIVSMAAVVAILFFIYYREKKDVKKALTPLLIVVLTIVLGVLADEAARRFDNNPTKPVVASESEKVDTKHETHASNVKNDEVNGGKATKSIKDFLYFLSPMGRNFAKIIDKRYFRTSVMVSFCIMANLLLIGWSSSDEFIPKLSKPFPLYVIKAILMVGNIYIIYIVAYIFSLMLSTILSELPEKIKLIFAIFMCSFLVVALPTIEILLLYYDNSFHNYDYLIKK